MNTSTQRKECELEALEPRLLLSADGLLGAMGVEQQVEEDVLDEQSSTVVIAYAMESQVGEEAVSEDGIFDVAGQEMEAAVDESEPADDSVAQVENAVVSSADSSASGSEPVAMASVYDSTSDTSQQLVQSLNAANAPPSEDASQSAVSSILSSTTSDESGSLQTQALSVLAPEEPLNQVMEAFNAGSVDDNLASGLAAFVNGLWELISNDPNFTDPHLPGLRDEEVTAGHASPTVLDAFKIHVNQFGDSSEYFLSSEIRTFLNGIDVNAIFPGIADFEITGLLDIVGIADALYKTVPPDSPGLVFLFYTGFANLDEDAPFGPEKAVQPALALMDLDNSGDVTIREAFSVLVIGNILDFIEKFPTTKEVAGGDDGNGTVGYDVVATTFADLRNGFTHTSDIPTQNTGISFIGLTAFLTSLTEPSYLDDFIDFSFSGVTDISSGDELAYDLTLNLTLKQPYLIDLGIAVEQLEIGFPLSGFEPGVGESDFVPIDYDPVPYADLKGSLTIPMIFRADGSGFSVSPTDDIEARASVSESLNNMTVHVGFLGMEGGFGPGGEVPEFLLNFPVDIEVIDPSSPFHLGFEHPDFAAGGDGVISFDVSGVVEATFALAQEDVILSQDVIFSLNFGTDHGMDSIEPIEVTVTAASTANNLDGGPLTDTQARQNLVDDVNAALAVAGLAGVVTASLNGSDMITLTLVATDAAVLGFNSQENFDGTGAGLAADVAFDFTSDVSINGAILISIDGGVPVLVTLSFTATGGDAASRRTDFESKLNAALDAAFGGDVLTGSLNSDIVEIAPDNGTSSLETTRTVTMSAEFDITAAELAAADPEDLYAPVIDPDADFFRITLPLDAKPGIDPSVSLNEEVLEIVADLVVDDGGTITFPLNDDIEEDYIGLERFVLADYLTLSGVDYNSFDPKTDSFQLLLDFNKVGAAEVANMIGQLRGWLERLANATMLRGYQLPFTEATLGEVLLFGDMFQYALLFDDGRDGVDPGNGEAPVFNDQGRLLFFVTDGASKTIVLAFSTAQEFAAALDHLGDNDPVQTVTVAGGVANYDAALKELTYDVRVTAVGTSNYVSPSDFDLDLSPIHSVETEVDALVSTALFFEATVGLDLKDSMLIFDDTKLNGPPDGLNNGDGVDIRTDIAITGAGDVSLITGRLTGNAIFTVTEGGGTTEVRVFKSVGPGVFDPAVVVNTATDTFTLESAHGLNTGDVVVYDNGGGDDIGDLVGDGATNYWVVRVNSTSFRLASSFANATAGTPVVIDIGDTGTGTSHEIRPRHNTDDNSTTADLLADINEAIATAGLGSDVEALAVAGRVVIQAKAGGPDRFAVSANLNDRAYTELGLPTTMATTVFLTGVDIDLTPFRVGGGFIDTAGFRISLNGNPSVGVNVSGLANSNSVADVVNDVNDALEATLLAGNIPLSDFIVATRNGNRLVLAAIDASIGVFSVLDKLGDTAATERLGIASTQLSNTFFNGVFLSQVAGVFLVGENFLDKAINEDASVASAFGRLANDAEFTLQTNAGDYAISILATATENFTDLQQLLDELNDAIDDHVDLDGKVVAYLVGTRFVLRSIHPDITSIEIVRTTVDPTPPDPGARELGLVTAAFLGVEEGARAGGDLRVAANRDVPAYFGPEANAHFTIEYELDGVGGPEDPVDVTLLLSEVLSNRTIYDLVSDVTLALNAAFEGASNNPFVAAFDGQRLVIRPKSTSTVIAFSITAATDDPAVFDLHLHPYANLADHPDGYDELLASQTTVANQYDLLVFTIDGGVHGVVLDDAEDIADVKDAFANADALAGATAGVTATINPLNTGLNLHDGTAIPDDQGLLFRVETVNGSKAVSGLGLQASSTLGILIQSTGAIDPVFPDDDDNRRLIEGDSVGRLEMQDRFFLRQVDADTPFLSAYIYVAIVLGVDWEGEPPDVPDSASYGFVGIEFKPSGEVFSIEFSMELNKEGDPLVNVTLTNLLDGLSEDWNGDGFVDIYDLNEVVTFPVLEPRAADYLEFDVDLAPGLPSNLATDLALPAATVKFQILDAGNPFIQKPGTAAFDSEELGGVVSVLNDEFTINSHGFSTGDKVTYRKGMDGAVIEGLKDNTVYYVIKTGPDTFKLAETKSKAIADTPIAIDLTDFGTGNQHRFLRFDTEKPDILTTVSGFGDLVNFANIDFGSVLSALEKLRDFINEFAELSFLGIPVPVIGVTLNDLLGIASNFAKAVADVTNNPAATLQQLTQKLRESFGLPPDSDPIQLALVDDDDGADGSTKDMLKVSLVLNREYTEAMMLELDFSGYLPDDPIFGAIKLLGRAGLGAKITIDAIFSVGVDLDDDGGGDTMGEVFLFTHEDDTHIKFYLDATSSVITFNAALGPLGILIIGGDGQIIIDIAFENPTAVADDRVSILEPANLLAAFADFEASMDSSFEITLPAYFPTASNYLGDIYFKATWDIGDTGPTIQDFDFPTDFGLEGFFEQFSATTNLSLIIDALDLFLETLQDILSGEILGLPLPFIGDKLSEGALFIEDLRSKIVAPFRELVSAADKTEAELVDLVQAFLFAILGDGIQPGSQIDQDFPELLSLLQSFEDLTGFAFTEGLGLLSGSDYALINTILPVVYTPPNSPFGLEYTLNLGDTINKNVNFDFDLGLPALGLDFDGGLAFEIEWALTIGIGVSTEKGVYINLGQENEFTVSVDAGFTPNAMATGRLGFLQLSAMAGDDLDGNGVDDTNHVTASFTIDLQNGGGGDLLSFFDLGDLEVVAGVEATADLDLLLELAFNRELLPPVVSAILPALEARFILEWGVSDSNVLDGLDLDFAESLTSVKFVDVYLDLGSFLGDFLGPIVSQIQEYTEPLQPIIDILTARIPVLSDLAGKTITLVDIAATFGEFDPGLIYAIADLISFVNAIPASPDSIKLLIAEEFVLVGSGLFGDSKNLLTDPTFSFANAMNPDSDSFIGALADAFESGDHFAGVIQLFDDVGGFIGGALGAAGDTPEGKAAGGLFGGDFNSDERGGFAFPFLQNPSSILGALLGNPIVLVTYDLPPLVVEFEWEVSFPIYPPLYGVVGAGLGVKIDLAFGYDTLGVQKFVEGGFSNPLDLLSGFYISDTENPDGSGADVGELQFKGQISVGAELNAGIASAGVTASIILTVDFDLNDPDGDGRVRLAEILSNFLYEWREGTPALAPLAIFDIYGEISFQLSAYIKILLFEASFNITPQITLFEFAIEFDREPILATERGNGSLLLNIGPNSGARQHGNTSDIGETINVKVDGNKVKVWSDQFGVPESAAQSYTLGQTKQIVAYGGDGDDTINITVVGDAPAGFSIYVEGNSGNDTVTVTGEGDAEIYGDDGDDTITSGNGNDVIYGGEGSDEIDGGAGNDIIFGDDGRISEALVTALVRDKDGNDTITGGAGRDIIFGSGGTDNLAGDGPFVLADPDSDTGGDGDLIFGDGARLIKPNGAGDSVVAMISDWTKSGYDAPGGVDDIIHGHGGPDVIYGGRGNDEVDGGMGNDTIYGGPGFDYLAGGGNDDTIFGGTEDDVIYGYRESTDANDPGFHGIVGPYDGADDGPDTVFGEDGNDFIRGNNGNDVLWGGRGSDIIFGDFDDDKAFGEDDNDFIFGGADDELNVQGGAGNDIVFGDDGIVVFIDFADLSFSSSFVNRLGHLINGDGHRIIGDGTFTDADPYAADGVHDGDPRTIDVIQTVVNGVTDGDDYVVGGKGDDVVFGGAKDDTVFGDFDPDEGFAGPLPIGNDILFGDGGRIEFFDRYRDNIRSIVGADLSEVGIDHVSGNAGTDVIFGNGAGDFLYGRMHSSFNGVGAYQEEADVRDDDIILGDDGEIDYEKGTGIIQTIETYFDTAVHPSVVTVGGADEIYGNKHDDIAFGGIAGDLIKGDDGLDGDDILIGDNGLIVYGDDDDDDEFGNPLVKIATIETTDVSEVTGGPDTIEGQDDNDVIIGGVNNGGPDLLYGDRATPTGPSIAADSQDIILGDNGKIFFNFGGDTDLDTLDRITTYTDSLGGADTISGNAGNDILFGGNGGDTMYGDDATASAAASDGEDVMFGDNGRIEFVGTIGRLLVQVAGRTTPSAVDFITTIDNVETTGGADTMSGNAKADIMLGGVNNGGTDTLYGDRAAPTATTITNDNDDILLGDNGELDFSYLLDTDRNTLDLIRSHQDARGGTDVLSGNKGVDVAIGGTAGDTIYGDDAAFSAGNADQGDILLGDNADIFLVAVGEASGGDLKVVLSAAVKTIRTTDTVDPANTGGIDTISGNAKGDIIAGGVYGDFLYGDRATPTPATSAIDGKDIILGDNGALEWLSTGRLGEIAGIDIAENNADLWAKYGTNDADTDLTTLDLITTEQPNSGGRDTIYGDEDDDLAFGGTDLDVIHGDDGDGEAETLKLNRDVLFGDHGRLYPQFARFRLPNSTTLVAATIHARNFFAIHTGDNQGGEGDLMWGEEGADIMLGQQGDDRMWGGTGDDDMIGGHNAAGGYDELTAPAVDIVLDGAFGDADVNDLMDGGANDDAMAGDNAIIWRRGDDFSPRFRTLANGKTTLYTTGPDGVDTIVTNIDALWRSDPADVAGRDIQLIDHSDAVQATPLGRFGSDVMAGGSHSDTLFGELGADMIQGDGSIASLAVLPPYTARTLWITDSGANPNTDETLYFNIPEAASDANDYIEGNGGSDLLYGGLGQDDILGGSSALFGLNAFYAAKLGFTAEQLRPDDSDIIFGGAGLPARLARNDFVGSTDTDSAVNETTGARPTNDDPSIALVDRHSRDADFIMGDNANVYRLVNSDANLDAFLEFNYDQSSPAENRGNVRIIVRATEQLDYTLGGSDYAGGTYSNGAAVVGGIADNGAADLIHGESGDDYIFGQTGSDVLYGESDDDDIIGGYGHDWISGGTGQDGILGDDGLLYTSRNSTLGEPLYGVIPLLANDPSNKYSNGTALDETISTPGDIQIAIINPTGALKKTADLVPFSFDPGWLGLDDEFPDNQDSSPFADDIIFGGLDSDFLHGGSGDDAISGAEALVDARVPTFDGSGNPNGTLNLGYGAFQTPVNINPGDTASLGALAAGDWLAFNPVDLDGQHLNNRFRAGEFFLYDEYDPRRKIMLTVDGELYKNTGGTLGVDYFEFVLNFNGAEGLYRPAGNVPKATGQQTESYPAVNDDGKDAIFGDNGNDWLVGGTGRDNLYGGWGNDLLNADDKHDIADDGTKQVTVSDTQPSFEDRAYGGAGRDILIGNTGGDRLIDWVGEYNSYLVPYAPFGQASVSRTMQPFLPEFLYALSAGDGADPTRYVDAIGTNIPQPTNNNPNPSRNGEPHGELGLVLQKDYAWQDQTGAPADPQAGNIPGGQRDVLRSASFNDGTSDGFFADSGKWAVKSGVFSVEPMNKGGDALSVFYVDDYVPSYFEMMATINAVKPTGGYKSNAYIVFDYQSETDFKFAGIDVSSSKLVIGHRTESGWNVVVQGVYTGSLKSGTNYNVFLAINGNNVILRVDNKVTLTHTFAPRIDSFGIAHALHEGMVGLGAENSKATIDNVIVQRLAPVMTFVREVDFSSGLGELFAAPASGTWSLGGGRYAGTPVGDGVAINLLTPDPAPAAVIDLSAVLGTTGAGGFVFDYYNSKSFKFVTVDRVTGTVTLGHRTAKGWFTDAVYSNAAIKTSADQALGLTIKGTTVSVKWGTSLVISHAFNALATDGATGLLGRSGTTSFNSVKFQSDDPTLSTSSASAPQVQQPASGSSYSAAQFVPLETVAVTPVIPSVVSIVDSDPVGPVMGSIVNDILDGRSNSSSFGDSGDLGSNASQHLLSVTTETPSLADTVSWSARPSIPSAGERLLPDSSREWSVGNVEDLSNLRDTSSGTNPAVASQPADDAGSSAEADKVMQAADDSGHATESRGDRSSEMRTAAPARDASDSRRISEQSGLPDDRDPERPKGDGN